MARCSAMTRQNAPASGRRSCSSLVQHGGAPGQQRAGEDDAGAPHHLIAMSARPTLTPRPVDCLHVLIASAHSAIIAIIPVVSRGRRPWAWPPPAAWRRAQRTTQWAAAASTGTQSAGSAPAAAALQLQVLPGAGPGGGGRGCCRMTQCSGSCRARSMARSRMGLYSITRLTSMLAGRPTPSNLGRGIVDRRRHLARREVAEHHPAHCLIGGDARHCPAIMALDTTPGTQGLTRVAWRQRRVHGERTAGAPPSSVSSSRWQHTPPVRGDPGGPVSRRARPPHPGRRGGRSTQATPFPHRLSALRALCEPAVERRIEASSTWRWRRRDDKPLPWAGSLTLTNSFGMARAPGQRLHKWASDYLHPKY